MKLRENLFSGSRGEAQTGMMKLIVAFTNFEKTLIK